MSANMDDTFLDGLFPLARRDSGDGIPARRRESQGPGDAPSRMRCRKCEVKLIPAFLLFRPFTPAGRAGNGRLVNIN